MPSIWAALHLLEPHADRPNPISVAGDRGFYTQDSGAELRESNVTPHVADPAMLERLVAERMDREERV